MGDECELIDTAIGRDNECEKKNQKITIKKMKGKKVAIRKRAALQEKTHMARSLFFLGGVESGRRGE